MTHSKNHQASFPCQNFRVIPSALQRFGNMGFISFNCNEKGCTQKLQDGRSQGEEVDGPDVDSRWPLVESVCTHNYLSCKSLPDFLPITSRMQSCVTMQVCDTLLIPPTHYGDGWMSTNLSSCTNIYFFYCFYSNSKVFHIFIMLKTLNLCKTINVPITDSTHFNLHMCPGNRLCSHVTYWCDSDIYAK